MLNQNILLSKYIITNLLLSNNPKPIANYTNLIRHKIINENYNWLSKLKSSQNQKTIRDKK